jgi:hypothetical protein
MLILPSETLHSNLTTNHGVMNLPGLGLQEPEQVQEAATTITHDLAKDCEWRFEVAVGKYVQVKVKANPFNHTHHH